VAVAVDLDIKPIKEWAVMVVVDLGEFLAVTHQSILVVVERLQTVQVDLA
jgi:hypothetical protein